MGPDNRYRPWNLSLYKHMAEHTGTEVLFKIKLQVLPLNLKYNVFQDIFR